MNNDYTTLLERLVEILIKRQRNGRSAALDAELKQLLTDSFIATDRAICRASTKEEIERLKNLFSKITDLVVDNEMEDEAE